MEGVWRLIELRVAELIESAVERAIAARLDAPRTPRLLDRDGIARVLGVHADTVDKWRRLGMPVVQIPGSHPRFVEADCIEWARKYRTKS